MRDDAWIAGCGALALLLGFDAPAGEGRLVTPGPANDSLPIVQPNDNRVPAGRLHGDTLELELEVRMARWLPESDSGSALEVAAFTEAGRAPEIPAPLIRVPAGTIVVATVRNRLVDSTIAIHGLITHPATVDDSFFVSPGAARTITFPAGAPGTYTYWATFGTALHRRRVDPEHEQVMGAFVVDPAGGSPADRVMVLNIWSTVVDSEGVTNALTINGKAWPYTERISATVGDTIRWRVVNGTRRVHPMHLHGFYFRLDTEGDGLRELPFPSTARPLQVTQSMSPLATMAMTWVPDRPGNWLFHCHIGYHVTPGARLEHTITGAQDHMNQSPMIHMAGLVMGITVRPKAGAAMPVRGKARRLHLFVQEGKRTGLAPRAMRYVLQRGAQPPAPDSIEAMSSVIVLHRDEPTDIVVVNRLTEAAAIHWHGIELESYSDGVAGWSGTGNQLAPAIAPGDSFVAHLTLPRAGTFIYHTHMNDIEQLTSGLYGGIVVLEPGQRLDPRRDHLYILGWDGEKPRLVVNGDSASMPLTLKAGVSHRLRFVNIGAGGRFRYSLYRDSTVAEWRILARDGADLPPALAVREPAREQIDVGETRDVEFLPSPGVYRLAIELPRGAVWTQEIRAIP